MSKRKINKALLMLVVSYYFTSNCVIAIVSPFNKIALRDTSSLTYTFIISGHFHGASTNASTFPASSLLANIDTLNSLKPSFLISLGDMFLDVNDDYINHYQKSLFEKLGMPLFNAVGNHDLSNNNMYSDFFGNTYFSFNYGHELFVILNTEINDGSIKNEQLDFLTHTLLKAASDQGIRNVFIFSHRPVWAENNERYRKLFKGNTRSVIGYNNFEEGVRPLLMKYSHIKNIVWVSGSLGSGPASFFYDKEPDSGLTFMQTAIRDQPRDACLVVTCDNGTVSFNGLSFTGQKLDKIESYNVDYWVSKTSPEQKFTLRLLPYLALQMIIHHYFWIGTLLGGCLVFLFLTIKNKKSKSTRT